MDDQALRERTHFETDLGLAALLIVAGVIGMGVYIGAVAYKIGSDAVKNRAKITYSLDVKTDHEPGQEDRLLEDVLAGRYGRHPAGATVNVEIHPPAEQQPPRLQGEQAP